MKYKVRKLVAFVMALFMVFQSAPTPVLAGTSYTSGPSSIGQLRAANNGYTVTVLVDQEASFQSDRHLYLVAKQRVNVAAWGNRPQDATFVQEIDLHQYKQAITIDALRVDGVQEEYPVDENSVSIDIYTDRGYSPYNGEGNIAKERSSDGKTFRIGKSGFTAPKYKVRVDLYEPWADSATEGSVSLGDTYTLTGTDLDDSSITYTASFDSNGEITSFTKSSDSSTLTEGAPLENIQITNLQDGKMGDYTVTAITEDAENKVYVIEGHKDNTYFAEISFFDENGDAVTPDFTGKDISVKAIAENGDEYTSADLSNNASAFPLTLTFKQGEDEGSTVLPKISSFAFEPDPLADSEDNEYSVSVVSLNDDDLDAGKYQLRAVKLTDCTVTVESAEGLESGFNYYIVAYNNGSIAGYEHFAQGDVAFPAGTINNTTKFNVVRLPSAVAVSEEALTGESATTVSASGENAGLTIFEWNAEMNEDNQYVFSSSAKNSVTATLEYKDEKGNTTTGTDVYYIKVKAKNDQNQDVSYYTELPKEGGKLTFLDISTGESIAISNTIQQIEAVKKLNSGSPAPANWNALHGGNSQDVQGDSNQYKLGEYALSFKYNASTMNYDFVAAKPGVANVVIIVKDGETEVDYSSVLNGYKLVATVKGEDNSNTSRTWNADNNNNGITITKDGNQGKAVINGSVEFNNNKANPQKKQYQAGDQLQVYLTDNYSISDGNLTISGTLIDNDAIVEKDGTFYGFTKEYNEETNTYTYTGQKLDPYYFTFQVKDKNGQITETLDGMNGWYLVAEVTRDGNAYTYVKPVNNLVKTTVDGNTINSFAGYGMVNNNLQFIGNTAATSPDEFVTFKMYYPADTNQVNENNGSEYFANEDHIKINGLNDTSIGSKYTLEVEGNVVTLQEAADTVITVSESNGDAIELEGTYYVLGEMDFTEGGEQKSRYAIKPLNTTNGTEYTFDAGFTDKDGQNAEYLTGIRFVAPALVRATGPDSNDPNKVLKAIAENKHEVTIYRDGDAVGQYRLAAKDATLETESKGTITLTKLPGLQARNDAVTNPAPDDNNSYYLLAERIKDGKKSYAYAKVPLEGGTAAPLEFHEEGPEGEIVYYAEEDEVNFYAVELPDNADATLEQVKAGKRYAEGQLMTNYVPSFDLTDGVVTTTLTRRTDDPTSYKVQVDVLNAAQTGYLTHDAEDPDKIAGNYYVVATLKSKESGQVVGYTVLDVDEDALNSTGKWSDTIGTQQFSVCDAKLEETGATMGYDYNLYDISLRMYEKDKAHNATYKELTEKGSDEAPKAHDFIGVFPTTQDRVCPEFVQDMIDSEGGNSSHIVLHSAYEKEYGIRVYVDIPGMEVTEDDQLMVRVRLIHEQPDQKTFAFFPLTVSSTTGGDTPEELSPALAGGLMWRDGNGSPTNYTFTGNEKGYVIDVLRYKKNDDSSIPYGELVKEGSSKYTLVPTGESINLYTLNDGTRETVEDVENEKTKIYDSIRFTKDVNGIKIGELQSALVDATNFGLYTELLSLHATDMESNIGAARLSGQIGADYGFSGNNIRVNQLKVTKRYIGADGNPASNKTINLKLYPVEKINPDGTYQLGDPISASGTTNSEGVAEIVFNKLVSGNYVLKEVLENGQEVTYGDGENGVVLNAGGTENFTVSFADELITIENINVNVNYFGQIDDSVNFWNIIRHSRNGWIVTDNQEDYTALWEANGNSSVSAQGQIGLTGGRIPTQETNNPNYVEFPDTYNIPADMANLRALSSRLLTCGSSQTVKVMNVKAQDIAEKGLTIEGDGRFVVVNVDVSGMGNVVTFNPETTFNGTILKADFGAAGSEHSSKVLYNIVSNGAPFTGVINTAKEGAGILLAPAGIVADLGGNWGGTIICKEARHTGSEIHSDSSNKIQKKNTMLTNSLKPLDEGNLTIAKQFDNNDVFDRTTWFTFRVTLTPAENFTGEHTYVASGLEEGNTITFVDGVATVNVRAQNEITIAGLRSGTHYALEEIQTASTEHYTFKEFKIENAEGTVKASDGTGEISKGNTAKIIAVNTTEKGGLKIKKIANNTTDTTKDFKFHLYLWKIDESDATHYVAITGQKGNYNFADGGVNDPATGTAHVAGVASFTLKAGQEIEVSGIEMGVYFKLVEDEPLPAGYTFASGNGEGYITGNVNDIQVVFENDYSADGSIVLEASKARNARLGDEKFTFELYEGTELLDSVTAKQGETEQFTVINYTLDDLGEHKYTIKEVQGDKSYIKYDNTEYKITVTVEDDGEGGLTVTKTVDPAQDVVFKNGYSADGSIVLEASKARNARLGDEKFTFELYEGTELLESVTAKQGETKPFTVIKYTLDDLGEHEYTIVEAQGDKSYITYDDTEYKITVTVSDDGKGNLTAVKTVTPDGEVVFTNEYDAKGSAVLSAMKAGDELLGDKEFRFELLDAEDNVIQTSDGVMQGETAVFDAIEYELDEAGKVFTYRIREQIPEDAKTVDGKKVKDGVTYDDSVVEVKVLVADNHEGELTVKYNGQDTFTTPEFTNTYDSVGSIVLSGAKFIDTRDFEDGDSATFRIEAITEGAPLPEETEVTVYPKSGRSIDFAFEAINYKLEDLKKDDGTYEESKTYEYKVIESAFDMSGVIKDSTEYMVKITVDDKAQNGILNVTPDVPVDQLNFTNRETTVQVSKVDVTDDAELPGAHIQILDEDGNVVDEWDSELPPHVTKGLEPGKEYTLHETVGPDGYSTTTDSTFIIDEEGNVTTTGYMSEDGVLLVKDSQVVYLSVTKQWEDEGNRDGIRPTSLEITLYVDGEAADKVILNEQNNWTSPVLTKDRYRIDEATGKAVMIEYEWKEQELAKYELTETKVSQSAALDGGWTMATKLVNTYGPGLIEVPVTKVWVDDGNKFNKRPDSVKVQLYADGIACDEPVTLNAGNNWSYTWTGLDRCTNPTGRTGAQTEIKYTIEEIDAPADYVSVITGNQTMGFTLTNTLKQSKLVIEKAFDIIPKETEPDEPTPTPTPSDETVDIPVTKTWQDDDDADGIRPANVTVRLYANGKEIDSAVLTEPDGWAYTFRGLPKYEDEKEIVYTVTEDQVEGYDTEIDGYSVTNTRSSDWTSVTVMKVWDDSNDKLRIRPKSIRMTLSNGTSVVLNKENNWTATVDHLPTKENGKTIEYTWTEQEVLGYKQISVKTTGTVTVFTNAPYKKPGGPGEPYMIIEEYGTPLGIEITINHVGDCFD